MTVDPTFEPAAARLRAAAGRFLGRVGHWGPPRWAAPIGDGPATRADVVHALIQRLADASAAAEHRPPRPVPRLDNDLALPDQLRVMVDDLLRTASPDTLDAATAALDTTATTL